MCFSLKSLYNVHTSVPLYREFLQFIKNGRIIAILKIAIYKNSQIIPL
jgi:hypothetical protein